MDKMNWKDVWLSNYKGQSDAGKELDSLMKKNYKGHNYIPWAVMVKWLYLMDEDAKLEVINSSSGQHVHTSSGYLSNQNTNKKGETENQNITITTHTANFVVLKCTFMGKVFEEVYPIQDNSYNAPNYYDSNMVNKSIQRAKAKIISIATGLAFSLYETGDLQFEDDTPKTPQKTVIETPKVGKNVVNKVESTVDNTPSAKTTQVTIGNTQTTTDTITTSHTEDVLKIVDLIHNNKDDILQILQTVNKDIVKSYGFALSTEDSRDDLANKLDKLNNPSLFLNALTKRLSDSKGVK